MEQTRARTTPPLFACIIFGNVTHSNATHQTLPSNENIFILLCKLRGISFTINEDGQVTTLVVLDFN